MRTRRSFSKLLYFLPGVLVLCYAFVYPMIRLVVISFQRKAGDQVVFAGLSNYSRVLNDSVFFASIRNNGILIAIVVPVLVLVCLIFAVIIYKLAKGTRFFQVIIFAPYILSIAATGVLFSYLLQQNGIVNELLRRLMLGKLALDWIGSSRIAIITIALIIVWKETGFGTILFISRLETLSEEYVDAMKIDGANWWQALFNLYIPHLKGILFFYTTLIVINMLSWVFNYVFVMTGGANNTMVFEMYVYRQLFLYSNKWTGSASAVLVSIVVFGLILLQMQSRAGLSQEDTE